MRDQPYSEPKGTPSNEEILKEIKRTGFLFYGIDLTKQLDRIPPIDYTSLPIEQKY